MNPLTKPALKRCPAVVPAGVNHSDRCQAKLSRQVQMPRAVER